MLRVEEEEEVDGLDIIEHGSPGYGEGFGSFVPTAPSTMSASSSTAPAHSLTP
jgi:hypothetical protein